MKKGMERLRESYYTYDVESFPNMFSVCVQNTQRPENIRTFEISRRKNDLEKLQKTFRWLKKINAILVGYNNQGYDRHVIAALMGIPSSTKWQKSVGVAYKRTQDYFLSQKSDSYYKAPKGEFYFHNMDLMKLHGLEKKVSLKMLEFNMQRPRIVDMPFEPGTAIPEGEEQTLID